MKERIESLMADYQRLPRTPRIEAILGKLRALLAFEDARQAELNATGEARSAQPATPPGADR